ncbi:hypothetical protein J19TS1_19740 [Heyndrickxia oleronia]|nr:hypothetical protein J19TS1_19740 [Heyndrickxia oleronia]
MEFFSELLDVFGMIIIIINCRTLNRLKTLIKKIIDKKILS